ncbi:hypothetical protein D1007_57419 [Hordeum vulgare]|nr:hypothetical protein D1007_57419 [Hordeum vulgare]
MAAMVVNRMLKNKQTPLLTEGFSRITFCMDDDDIKKAVDMCSALGPSHSLALGVFGYKSKGPVQTGIMKFLKKVDTSKVDKSIRTMLTSSERKTEQQNTTLKQENLEASGACSMQVEKKLDNLMENKNKFDLEKASDVIVDAATDFIFFTFVGDITQLHSKGGLQCNVIANAANWRLKPGGGGVNAAIFNAVEVEVKGSAPLLPWRQRGPGRAAAAMAALPVMKLGTLLLRTMSKPIANRLKSQAAVHPKFRDFIISIAQFILGAIGRRCCCVTRLLYVWSVEGGMFGMRASSVAVSWVVGWIGTNVHLYDDTEDAAIPALLDSHFDVHLTSSYHYRTSVGDWGMAVT